jgi:predicted neutral ceramidase superfamily lipid hydrolase
MRQPILDQLKGLVDAAEVMTTDNHVVHEVDGTINSLGERYPVERIAADVRAVVVSAVADLAPAEVRVGTREIPDVPVLGPAWTARLLTSLGDTVSMFANALLITFLLLVAGSLVILLAIR